MNEKTKAIVGYIVPLVAIIFFVQKETDKKTKFHCAQEIVIFVAYLILSFITGFIARLTGIGFISWFAYAFYVAFVVMGIVKANSDGEPELPVVGDITKSIFGKALGE